MPAMPSKELTHRTAMPTGNFRNYIDHYLAPHPAHEVKEIFVSTAILDVAVSMIALFEPIYLWKLGYGLPYIAGFYVALYATYFLLLPLGARISRSRGNEHAMLFSSPFLIAYYLAFYAIAVHPAFMAVACLALALQKILFWPGYHANFAEWLGTGEEGREISNRNVVASLASILAPVAGGFIVTAFGFSHLFVVVSILILLSNVPLLATPERFTASEFAYAPAMLRLAQPENRKRLGAFMGFGEELIAMAFWPIFIAMTIPNLFSLGIVVSFAMLANVVMALYVGRATDESGTRAVLKTGVVYTGLAWLVRPFIAGGFGIFLMDSYYRVAKNAVNVPVVALIYKGARRKGIMESVVFFEQALSLGKILAGLLCMAAFILFRDPWVAVFLLGVAFTALFALMPAEEWGDIER
jgi:MFS family permease